MHLLLLLTILLTALIVLGDESSAPGTVAVEPVDVESKKAETSHYYSVALTPTLWQSLEIGYEISKWGMDSMLSGGKAVLETLGVGDLCPFSEDASTKVEKALWARIKSQPLALDSIISAISVWDFAAESGQHQPLVMALTGSTGVGKTETAWVIAEALLANRIQVSGGSSMVPRGFVNLRGEDFSDGSVPMDRYHSAIKKTLLKTLRECSGNAVVLFDEIQKVVPGTLDVLLEPMSEHPVLSYYSSGQAATVDTSKVVWILVTDIGADSIQDVILSYKKRDEVPLGALQSSVKQALDNEWEKLKFAKVIDRVVPYLPMSPHEMLQVLELKLHEFNSTFAGEKFSSLCTSPELRRHLVGRQFITYGNYSNPEGLEEGTWHYYADYGARNLEHDGGPLHSLKSRLYRHLKPWQPSRAISISYDKGEKQVVLKWCHSCRMSADNGHRRVLPNCLARSSALTCVSIDVTEEPTIRLH
ncbi:unnamed protein product [Chrysoparadoxa australica]